MAGNSLQAMLDRAKVAPAAEPETPAAPKTRKAIAVKAPANAAAPAQAGKKGPKPSRAATKLIGGHFAPEFSTQLRIIAAEEDTTLQALLTEALNDLFVKKGKARISGL